MSTLQNIVNEILTKEDYELESTAQSIPEFESLLTHIELEPDDKFVDIGCGAGGFTKVIQSYFNLNQSYGIDKNKKLLSKAEERNIITYNKDIIESPLPFDDNSVNLVTCLGTLEHLPEFDTVLKEIKRILKTNGIVIFALPNLSSWINRMSLLFGWEPRNIEVSTEKLLNTAPWYNDEEILYHIHTPTFNGFNELLKYHGYDIKHSTPLFPYQENSLVKIIDYITKFRPQLSRRFGVVATI